MSTIPPQDPPRRLTGWLSASLPPSAADEIVGDLHEEYRALAASRGVGAARLWYAAQACRLTARFLPRRVWHGQAPSMQAPHPTRGDTLMRTVLSDGRHALRGLVRRPALSALVVITLALGLAANASMFQVIDALIVRPFTFSGVDRIAMVTETGRDFRFDTRETVSPANYRDIAQQADTFAHLAAFEWWDVNIASEQEAERGLGFFVTANFFAALGVQPALGRTFTRDEEIRGQHRRVILSHEFWARRFAADRSVLGRTILLDAEPFEIIGVMPQGFSFPMDSTLWAPLAFDAKTAASRDARYLTVVGRLAEGRSFEEAQAQVAAIGAQLARQYPEANKDRGAQALTLNQGMRDQGIGPIASLWQASAAFVLLIACANIANLLFARGAERQREIAVRTALGASRGRIVRELLIESALLAAIAVPLALGFAGVAIEMIRRNLPASLVRFVVGWQTMDVDGRLIVFTAVLALLAALVFGLLPALRASRPMLADSLKDGGRGSTAGRSRQHVRRALVVVQIALALPLLVASGLSTVGAYTFLRGAQGYNPDALLTMRAALPESKYAEPAARRQFVHEVERRLSEMPGVQAVTVANVLPATGSNPMRALEIEGRPNPDPANPPTVDYRAVVPSYFSTLEQPLLRGRAFHSGDTADSQPVAVISASMAKTFFAGEDPIGRRLRFGDGPWMTIVGVTGDVIHNWFSGRNRPTIYRPYDQAASLSLAIAIRAGGDPSALVLPVQAAIRRVDDAQAVYDVMTMHEALRVRTIGLQYVAGIMLVFGVLALLLAVVGVYSVMAFMVAQRTHEIGVRIALGATRADVFRLTIGNAARLTAIGVGLGLLASTALSRVLESALDGVLRSDARVSFGVAVVLIASAVLAGYLPARRATAIDPVIALRD